MQMTLQKAGIDAKPIIANLLELYEHDFTGITPFEEAKDVDESGRYGYKYLDDYWSDPSRYPFIIRVYDKIAGFVFVNLNHEEGKAPNTHGISEFFVMKKYRNKGVGEEVARQIFDMFPGKWQIGQTNGNIPAQNFWRKVISNYTNGHFTDSKSDKGPRQRFENIKKI